MIKNQSLRIYMKLSKKYIQKDLILVCTSYYNKEKTLKYDWHNPNPKKLLKSLERRFSRAEVMEKYCGKHKENILLGLRKFVENDE